MLPIPEDRGSKFCRETKHSDVLRTLLAVLSVLAFFKITYRSEMSFNKHTSKQLIFKFIATKKFTNTCILNIHFTFIFISLDLHTFVYFLILFLYSKKLQILNQEVVHTLATRTHTRISEVPSMKYTSPHKQEHSDTQYLTL
jgi:hypothetical protein